MTKLVVHPSFQPVLHAIRNNPPQGILLHSSKGVGLGTLAQYVAKGSTELVQPLTKKGDVDESGGTITIERIRDLYEQTRSGAIQCIIIDDADRMSHPAQNALLKLLEEPGTSVRFILTSHRPQLLLPTITSRVIQYHVPPTAATQDAALLGAARLDQTQQAQAMFLAAGRPAELVRLSQHPEKLAQRATTMSVARTFLTDNSRYVRLRVALQYASSRADALELVDAALQIVRHTLYTQPSKDTASTADRLLLLHETLNRNANPRLQLTQFVLK